MKKVLSKRFTARWFNKSAYISTDLKHSCGLIGDRMVVAGSYASCSQARAISAHRASHSRSQTQVREQNDSQPSGNISLKAIKQEVHISLKAIKHDARTAYRPCHPYATRWRYAGIAVALSIDASPLSCAKLSTAIFSHFLTRQKGKGEEKIKDLQKGSRSVVIQIRMGRHTTKKTHIGSRKRLISDRTAACKRSASETGSQTPDLC